MPPAVLAWLDYSEADQRQAREIIALFSQQESRDELGLGRIRDALSDTLFPGTSVLLTRARYFLFIPWLFIEGARRGHRSSQLATWVDYQERRLIGALRNGGDLEGLIGRDVGAAVKNLPSDIYWNSLRRFRILRHGGTTSQIVGLRQDSQPMDDATEFLEHSDAVWAPSIPTAPEGFFEFSICDFALTHDEATWLSERIVDAVPEALLQVLVTGGNRHTARAQHVWDDPEAVAVTGHIRDSLDEARRFAIAMHGAALLYNVLLAERAEELGLTEHDDRRDFFADQLDEWSREIDVSDVAGWDLNRLWTLVEKQGRPAALRTRSFVTMWVSVMRRRIHRLADDAEARSLVQNREFQQKGSQARLSNDRLMRQWGGASGSDRLTFRWPAVVRLLNDIADGREPIRART